MIKALSASLAVLAAHFVASPAAAQDRAGVFDYWLLALTWTPSWCEAEAA
jgi:ribonuclease T2